MSLSLAAYNRRVDLQMSGRTVMGRMPPRGQELCDHCTPLPHHTYIHTYIHTYTLTWSAVCCTADMAPPSIASPALSCMQEIQAQCFKLGIPLRTRHRGGCADLTRPLPNSSL